LGYARVISIQNRKIIGRANSTDARRIRRRMRSRTQKIIALVCIEALDRQIARRPLHRFCRIDRRSRRFTDAAGTTAQDGEINRERESMTQIATSAATIASFDILEHDQEKWIPVFRPIMRQNIDSRAFYCFGLIQSETITL
jgi:hypothetical protein